MSEPEPHHDNEPNPLQGYFDWQVTTLMLAYDLHDPIDRAQEDEAVRRRQRVEREVRDLSLAQVPREYLEDNDREWTPDVMRAITRATLRRAGEIVNTERS